MALTIDTTQYPNGAVPLTLSAGDAASPANVAAPSETVHVDNQPVSLSLSGPTDAASTKGTQYISVAASAGPSGVGIACSLDGSAYQWHQGASEQVAVSGLGTHQLACYAQNSAIDPSGNPARSSLERWTLRIGEPTLMGIAFTRVVDPLRCHVVPQRIALPGHFVTIYRHHHAIHVHKRAGYKVVKVIRCHERRVRRRITVPQVVLRNGKHVQTQRPKTVWVAVPPHVVGSTTRRVRHGRGTTVDGWLGTLGGTALGGEPVRVLTAPDNGQERFRLATIVRTAADGSWRAQLRPGPSRLVEAVYDGGAITESAVSSQVHLVVPARVKLISISPRRVPWGGTVRIVGQLVGGYLPPGGALVRLRIGFGAAYTTYGVQEHVTGEGRFTATYTFGLGEPGSYRTYWFQIASLPMGDYPWAPASSGKLSVVVGGHP